MGWTHNTKNSNAPTIGPMITGVATALTFLSLITVCLRTYVRALLIHAFGIADDWIILVTWVAAAGFAIITSVQTRWGLGLKQVDDLPVENVYNFGLLQYMGAPFYITSILGFKLALLFSYLRFIPLGAYRYTIIGVITACIMFHLAFLLVQINLCQPVSKQWDTSITYGSCIPGVPFYTSMASLTMVFDVTVILLPFPVLAKSRLQTRKKVILLGLFGLGIFITVIQIIRIQTVKHLANYIDSAPLILWSNVENNLGIIVANVPTLAPLVKYYHEHHTSKRNTTDGGGGGGRGAYHRETGGTVGGTAGGRQHDGSHQGSRGGTGTGRSIERSLGLTTLRGSDHDMTEQLGSFSHVAKGNGSAVSVLDPVHLRPPGVGEEGDEGAEERRRRAAGTPGGITKKVEISVTRS
ncbi:hypothetical protein N658DRAFT_428256 [Parathielavia hyrcaniae]|uniref:Rhodopsin domain-containing protein n=1 Tax=Parathielavia hyrcaniae TaxID=113614 RepID=A0AAN6PZQ9_9PEZI|nr:hypothetical protein N658DRAFT_428256 [Parathielavia hyrcaniae]